MVKGLVVPEGVSNPTYFTVSFVAGSLAMLLNVIEVLLIRRAKRNTTDFELMLLNLATADFLSGLFFVVDASIHYYVHITKRFEYNLIVVSVWFYSTPVIVSTNFVLLISLERLFAVRYPVKHRLWHSTRFRVLKTSIGVWAITIIFTVAVVSLDQILNKKHLKSYFVASVHVGYVFAGYMAIATLIMLITYVIIAKTILRRNAKFLRRPDANAGNRPTRKSCLNDRTILTVCFLVVTAFLACNMPLAVDFVNAKAGVVQFFLTQANPIINPLIYFFKGYTERLYAKKANGTTAATNAGLNTINRSTTRVIVSNDGEGSHETVEISSKKIDNGKMHKRLDIEGFEPNKTEANENISIP